MLSAINTETAAQILLAADVHDAASLRERCMRFMLANFDAVSMTEGFEEMSRANLDLNLEVIRRRLSGVGMSTPGGVEKSKSIEE